LTDSSQPKVVQATDTTLSSAFANLKAHVSTNRLLAPLF
jgi:hypothetical protein